MPCVQVQHDDQSIPFIPRFTRATLPAILQTRKQPLKPPSSPPPENYSPTASSRSIPGCPPLPHRQHTNYASRETSRCRSSGRTALRGRYMSSHGALGLRLRRRGRSRGGEQGWRRASWWRQVSQGGNEGNNGLKWSCTGMLTGETIEESDHPGVFTLRAGSKTRYSLQWMARPPVRVAVQVGWPHQLRNTRQRPRRSC